MDDQQSIASLKRIFPEADEIILRDILNSTGSLENSINFLTTNDFKHQNDINKKDTYEITNQDTMDTSSNILGGNDVGNLYTDSNYKRCLQCGNEIIISYPEHPQLHAACVSKYNQSNKPTSSQSPKKLSSSFTPTTSYSKSNQQKFVVSTFSTTTADGKTTTTTSSSSTFTSTTISTKPKPNCIYCKEPLYVVFPQHPEYHSNCFSKYSSEQRILEDEKKKREKEYQALLDKQAKEIDEIKKRQEEQLKKQQEYFAEMMAKKKFFKKRI